MNDPSLVRFGRPVPVRIFWGSIISAALLIGLFLPIALHSAHPENAPFLLMFLLIPAIVIPVTTVLNTYAVLDTSTWMVRVNGGLSIPPRASDVLLRGHFSRGLSHHSRHGSAA